MDDARAPQAPWPDDDFVDFAQARQHTLLRAAYLVSGDLWVAEDVVRGALVQLARQWVRVREEQPDLFVRRVVYHDAVASWRRRQPPESAAGTADATDVAAEPIDVDDEWDGEDADRRREVLAALDALTPRQRAVVVLLWFEERSHGEAADVLGCGAEAVRGEAEVALAALRAALPRVDLGTGGGR
jgi:RNA polymerase sigma factor (sigma-70 family)